MRGAARPTSALFSCIRLAATTPHHTLSLHDALPILAQQHAAPARRAPHRPREDDVGGGGERAGRDRKSTRLNSSHITTSYAVFCLKNKNSLPTRNILPSTSAAEFLRAWL